MRKYFYLLYVLLFLAGQVQAQPNSVELKDGTGAVISSHASVTDAYAAIPATLTQAYTIETTTTYTGTSETFPIIFTLKAGASAVNTITLRPAAGVTSVAFQASMPGNAVFILDDADYVMIDGRPGGAGTTGVMAFNNLGTTSNSNTIVLRNGACFNRISHCLVLNATTSSAGRGLQLSTSASNPSGNSDNTIAYCTFSSGRYHFNSSGTTANPNTRNTVFGCSFQNMIFVGVWGQSGTGKMRIDSCNFSCNTASGSGLFFSILFDSQDDTLVITNNRIFDMQDGSTGTVRCIHIRSVATGGTNFSDINNNFISLMTGNTNITNIAGIEYSGTNPTYGRVVNNTVRIGSNLLSGGTSGSVGSSGLILSNSSASSSFEVKNNIFINERTGGTAGLQHLATAITNISPTYDMDYNTYNSVTGNLARWGTTAYTSISAYQAAVGGEEANTNDEPVQLVATNDLHLAGTSLNNYALAGTAIAGINTDIDGELRGISPYRGADEANPALPPPCSGTPDPGSIAVESDSLCMGDTVMLSLTQPTVLGLTFQWQSSTDGITFANIPGATDTTYSEVLTGTTWYQSVVTCELSGMSDTAVGPMVVMGEAPSGGVISETHTGLTYNYSVDSLTGTYNYEWNFGDGFTSTTTNPVHTYASNGIYMVSVVVSNECGDDTLYYTTSITLGMPGMENTMGIGLFPNPATDGFKLVSQNLLYADRIQISDATGRIFWTSGAITALPLDLSAKQLQLGTGMYMVTVEASGQRFFLRLIVR